MCSFLHTTLHYWRLFLTAYVILCLTFLVRSLTRLPNRLTSERAFYTSLQLVTLLHLPLYQMSLHDKKTHPPFNVLLTLLTLLVRLTCIRTTLIAKSIIDINPHHTLPTLYSMRCRCNALILLLLLLLLVVVFRPVHVTRM